MVGEEPPCRAPTKQKGYSGQPTDLNSVSKSNEIIGFSKKSYVELRKSLTFPKASKPLSKKRITPSNVKKMPNPIRPKPTSAIFAQEYESQKPNAFTKEKNLIKTTESPLHQIMVIFNITCRKSQEI